MDISNLVIWATEDCNLACDYCYEHHNKIGLNSIAVKKTIADLFRGSHMNLKKGHHQISFFGGEPLLQFDKIVDLIDWLESSIPRVFNYGITTNGTLITPEIAQYLKDKNFGVLFSIDGDREAMMARSNSYDDAIVGWNALKSAGVNAEANMTFSPTQMLRWKENIQHMIDIGFISFNLNKQEMVAYDIKQTFDIMLELYEFYIQNWLPLGVRSSAISKPFRAIKNMGVPSASCGAGKGFVSISPTGDVYPCHHMIQMKPTKLSTDTSPIRGDVKGWWEGLKPKANEDCNKCIVRNICTGSCPAINAVACGDFHKPEPMGCGFVKASLLAAQMVYSQLTDEQIQEVLGNDNEAACRRD